MAGTPAALFAGGYPERDDRPPGKLERLANELRYVFGRPESGARALVGGCVELDGGGIPFAPLVDMIRALVAELPPEDLDAVLGSAREEIARLVPELEAGAGAPSGDDSGPSRVLELILGMIGRLAAAASWDGMLRLWKTGTGRLVAAPIRDTGGGEFWKVAFRPDGRRLLVTGKHWPKMFQIRVVPR